MPRAELGMLLAAFEQAGLDVAILVGPVRAPGAAIDMGAPSVLQPRDEAARPGLACRADPRALDGEQVERAKAVPVGIEAAQDLHEMVEIAAVPIGAAQRPARGQDLAGHDLVGSGLAHAGTSQFAPCVLSTKPSARNSVSSRMALATAASPRLDAVISRSVCAAQASASAWARA